MGYKLAGCEVVGCCEIDKQMNDLYIVNHHPKYNFLMDIRDFNKLPNEKIPEELFDIDVLDGSPPCTTFSLAGQRKDNWGIKKKFREGQKEQTLDDLAFVFIETVKKLHPKVVIMENVEGLLLGEAWKYVQQIYADFSKAGYDVKHWLLKGENMGVPQARHRVFFVAIRKDLQVNPNKLNMCFNYQPITFGEIKDVRGDEFEDNQKDGVYYNLFMQSQKGDISIAYVCERIGRKPSGYNDRIVWDDEVFPTIIASHTFLYRGDDKTKTTANDYIKAQTFPRDYYFGEPRKKSTVAYVCGMSVPPIMIKRIMQRLIEQGVFEYKKGEGNGTLFV